MNANLEERVRVLTEKYHSLGDSITGTTTRMPTIVCSYRPSRTAGWAKALDWTISINIPLHQLYPQELEDTVAHEVAHLYATSVYKDRGHGRAWKLMMHKFGKTPNRLHHMDTTLVRKKVKKYTYVCVSCGREYSLGSKRHRKQQQWRNATGNSWYFDRKCKYKPGYGHLRLVDKSPVAQPTAVLPVAQTIPVVVLPSGMTKKQQVEALMNQLHGQSRTYMINAIMQQVGMSKSGATTYLYNYQVQARKQKLTTK